MYVYYVYMYIKNLFIQKPKNTGFYYKLSNILKPP